MTKRKIKKNTPHVISTVFKVEFPMCSHTQWVPNEGQDSPAPTKTQGSCPIHDWQCPTCGFGISSHGKCNCAEMRY